MMRVISLFLVATAFIAGQASFRESGIAAFHQGRYSEALKQLTEAAKDQKDTQAGIFLALTKAATNDCKSALPALLSTPRSDSTLYRLTHLAAANCQAAAGDKAQAAASYADLRQKFPNDADVLYATARFEMRAFNDTTRAMFQRAPASYRVHQLSAEIFEVENRPADAAAEYRKAIDLQPTAVDLHYRLGRALLLQGHNPELLDQAAEQFRAELNLNAEDSASEFQLGQIAQVQGKSREAKQHFERALQFSPQFVGALIALAKLETVDKNYSRAIARLTRATSLQPNNEAAHYALLMAYRDSGDLARAQAEKATLDKLQKPADGEFSEFLKKLGEKQPEP
jgi:tetratricopeptide (TPR) repeat protein